MSGSSSRSLRIAPFFVRSIDARTRPQQMFELLRYSGPVARQQYLVGSRQCLWIRILLSDHFALAGSRVESNLDGTRRYP